MFIYPRVSRAHFSFFLLCPWALSTEVNRCAPKLYETPTELHKTIANMQKRAGKTQYLYHIVHYGRRQTHIPQSLSLIINRERKIISREPRIVPSRPPHIVKYHSRAEHDPNCKSFSSVYSNPLRLHRVCSVSQPPPSWRDISRRTSVDWQLPCIVQSEYSYLFIYVHI